MVVASAQEALPEPSKTMDTTSRQEPPEWQMQRDLFDLLAAVHELSGGDCTRAVSLWEVGATPGDLRSAVRRFEELFRLVKLLEEEKFLLRMSPTPLVCITPKGIHYVEHGAGRRRSLRLSHIFPEVGTSPANGADARLSSSGG
jgi:hypothetical protein